MKKIYLSLQYLLLIVVMTAIAAPGFDAKAFNPDKYAPSSVLSVGRWVKISVPSTGLYAIPAADLRRWGFNDPAKVRVYGYGGNRISDLLTAAEYIDDLPEVQSVVTSRGLTFWALGPEKWTYDNSTWTHSLNPFSTAGYYYLTESDEPLREIPSEGMSIESTTNFASTFSEHIFHETDLVSPATLGLLLVGEDLRYTPSQTFRLATPGAVASDKNAIVRVSYLAVSSGVSNISLTANGAAISPLSSSAIQASADGGITVATGSFKHSSDNLSLSLNFTSSGTVSMANLDYIEVLYERQIALNGGLLSFSTASPAVELATAGVSGVTVWDVTDPLNISSLNASSSGNSLRWRNPYSGMRSYVAFSESATLPAPKLVGEVENQDLHGRSTPDMVIVSTTENLTQAERIAEVHRQTDGMDVVVVNQELVYNEFSSGSADPAAIRKYMKMLYDRSNNPAAGDSETTPGNLRYLLLMGRPTYDNRHLTSEMSSRSYSTLPTWTTDVGLNENVAYSSDDLFAMLEDNSGLRWGNERLCIAVGRIPSTSDASAKVLVDKIIDYINNPSGGEWASRMVLTADDQNDSDHLLQSEQMYTGFRSRALGDNINYKKIYFGAYKLSNGIYADAVSLFNREINDGVLWWNYIGHAAIDNLTGEGLLTTNDLYNLYLRKPLVFYGATCSFARWDGNKTCGVEALCLLESGGAVAAISAVRPVYISLNGILSKNLSYEVFKTDETGRPIPLGTALMNAKNNTTSDTNKRRYVLLGDPAMRLAVPASRVEITAINGQDATDTDNPPSISALEKVTMTGQLTDADGNLLDNFDGSVAYTIYDAEYSVISNEVDINNNEVSFEQQGNRLAAGRATVTGGRFEISLTMPMETSDNYRPAAMTLYAQSKDGKEASACFRNFYVYGFADEASTDDVAPRIEYMHLNHESFADGGIVNAAPMLVARISDNVGINLSSAGVGHQMSARIDGNISLNDVSSSYIPDEDGSPAGLIAYSLPTLVSGEHTVELKVWDVNGNSASKALSFVVDESMVPSIHDVYTDANPATTEANFYVTHDRPDEILNVTIEVFDMSGRLVWSNTSTGRADMYASAPVRWDLTSTAGGRVNRGIYIYRARIASADKPEAVSASRTRRLAVAAR